MLNEKDTNVEQGNSEKAYHLCMFCELQTYCEIGKQKQHGLADLILKGLPDDAYYPIDFQLRINRCHNFVDERILTKDKVMKKYPLLVSHIICESLGYASPSCAANILLDAINKKPNWCEWVYSCYGGNANEVVKQSVRSRHYHKGFMSEIKQAKALVNRAIKEGKEPEFASWF